MILRALTRADCEAVRIWRNSCIETLRTPYELTKKMQNDFYDNVICNRNSCHRYFGVHTAGAHGHLIGCVGITYIQWENSIGEISLIIDPKESKNGYGTKAVEALLDKAFNQMGLKTVFGECYTCNSEGVKFWHKITKIYNGTKAVLPNRKFWNGKYHDSVYFSIDRD